MDVKMVEIKKKAGTVISYDKIKEYTIHNVLTASGKRRAVDNGDVVSGALRGKTIKDYDKIREENNITIKNWDSLNPGLQRLALGNKLRKLLRFDAKVTILGAKLKKTDTVKS